MPASLSDGDLLARLVAFDTTSRNSNLPLADFLADYLDAPGAAVARNPSADGGKANLLVRVGPPADAAARAGLVLSGHMDVVPALEEGWESDPFALADRGDRFVARGSADMKGFLALAANLARETAAAGPPAAPLVLLFTYDEEVGTLGAHRLVETWEETAPAIGPLPRAAVIGEPTELRVVRLHKGHLKMRFRLAGRSAHSGYPHLGVNAVEAAGRAIVALSRLRRSLEAERTAASADFPQVPFAALNVGTVAGGSAVNVVPDRCELEVGVRVLPGMDSAELAARVRAAVAEGVAGDAAATDAVEEVPVTAEVLSDSPPLATPAGAPIHRHLCAAVGQRDDASVAFATDAGWLSRLGLDCVIFGPGSIEVAHRPNESVPKADLVAARGHLEALVHRQCREVGA
jgi:acetylornithine deacetylase